ncbi:MAG: bacillithiol biosynthesis cysteine-adding enzyme BshC, partial [Longimicrobiales bacterium]
LFGGPLYTVHKILTAVRLAETLEIELDRPVAPLFWVAADDHDWAEVDHTAVVDARNELRRVTVEAAPDSPPIPMSDRKLGPGIDAALDEFVALLPPSEFAPPLVELLRSAYRPDATVARAFHTLLAGLFADFDLLIVDPAHESVKRAASPVLRRELTHTADHAALLARQSHRLEEAGYGAQVTISEDASNVFFHDDAGRERLVRVDGSWSLRRTRRELSDDDVRSLLRDEPSRFSPNVLLRPVVEATLFPTIAYVGGPSEVAYFAQIGCLFAAHGIQPPVMHPRASAALVEGKVRKVLDKFGLEVGDVRRPFHEVATQRVRDEMPDAVTAPLARLRAAIREEYGSVRDAGGAIDPTLRKWVDGVRNSALGEVDNVEKKVASHLRKRNEVELEQLRKAAVNLYPDNAPQERVLNVLPYIAKYGSGVLRELARAMPCYLNGGAPGWTGVRCDG